MLPVHLFGSSPDSGPRAIWSNLKLFHSQGFGLSFQVETPSPREQNPAMLSTSQASKDPSARRQHSPVAGVMASKTALAWPFITP